MVETDLTRFIRNVPDFPIPGILFRDITPLIGDAHAFATAIEAMAEPWKDARVDVVASMEARGFLFGGGVALSLGAGFVPIRKEGKLPAQTVSLGYRLEYRSDVLFVHADAIKPGQRVLIVDDLMATGGTAGAVLGLVNKLGGEVVGAQFLIELTDLRGRQALPGIEVKSLMPMSGGQS